MAETGATMELLKKGIALTDIEAVVIRAKDKSYMLKTGTSASMKARVDAGAQKALRKRNRLLAQNNTADLLMGYDIELSDLMAYFEVVAIMEGGTVTKNEDGSFKSYKGPAAGEEGAKETFGLDVYCANRGTNNLVLNYQKFSYENCRGKSPVDWEIKDGEFTAPKYVIESCPNPGEAPMSVEAVDALPVVSA